METGTQTEELLEFFKALADANRLKIIGVLAQQPSTVEQLAAMLGLQSSTVSRHLSYLAHVGLVSARAEGYYSVYRFEAAALEAMAKRLLARETLPAVAADVDLDAFDRKVLRDFTRGRWPAEAVARAAQEVRCCAAPCRQAVRVRRAVQRETGERDPGATARGHGDAAPRVGRQRS